jgi:hypothetical protein
MLVRPSAPIRTTAWLGDPLKVHSPPYLLLSSARAHFHERGSELRFATQMHAAIRQVCEFSPGAHGTGCAILESGRRERLVQSGPLRRTLRAAILRLLTYPSPIAVSLALCAPAVAAPPGRFFVHWVQKKERGDSSCVCWSSNPQRSAVRRQHEQPLGQFRTISGLHRAGQHENPAMSSGSSVDGLRPELARNAPTDPLCGKCRP